MKSLFYSITALCAISLLCVQAHGETKKKHVKIKPAAIQHIFVIAMENTDTAKVYGNKTSAPYINDSLLPKYARSSNFTDQLPHAVHSEPHYIWMEAGTDSFSDFNFSASIKTDDADPSALRSTADTSHLVSQIRRAGNGLDWMSYQEGLSEETGACPIATSDANLYGPKHDPFVFFQDVAGNPPSKTNAYCSAHHKSMDALAQDLLNKNVASYNFITPNMCNDMHGVKADTSKPNQRLCPDKDNVRSGDDWLRANLPSLIAYANANAGVIFIVWDEGDRDQAMPFIAIGPHVKKGYVGDVHYTHSSMLKSIERILKLPILPTVTSDSDFADLFTKGNFP